MSPRNQRHTGHDASGPVRLFVDSSAWLALASPRDQYHAVAETLFREAVLRRRALITTNLVVAEVHRLLLFRAGVPAAAHALNRLEDSPALTIEFPTVEHHRVAREWLARLSNHPITYTDAVSFAVMATSRCNAALTFDSDFELAGFPIWRAPTARRRRGRP